MNILYNNYALHKNIEISFKDVLFQTVKILLRALAN